MFKFGAIVTSERQLRNQPQVFNNPQVHPTRILRRYLLPAALQTEAQRLFRALAKAHKEREYDLSREVFR
jgi:hypothetical protein